MTKRILSLMTTLIMMISFTVPTLSVFADNDLSSAVNYTLGTNVSDIITDQQNKLLYKFDINSSGRIQIDAIAQIREVNYRVYNDKGEEVWLKEYIYANGTTGQSVISDDVDLLKGTYYFCIEQYSGTGNFNFILTFTSANESFSETNDITNNTFSTANNINLNTTYNGQIAKNDSVDFYNFTINNSERLYINAIAQIREVNYRIYNNKGEEVWSNEYIYANGTTGQSVISDDVDLLKGTYYFCIEQYSGTGNFNFILTFTSANESFSETNDITNNTFSTANNINLNTTYNGQIAKNDSVDFYNFTINNSERLYINAIAQIREVNYRIYNNKGEEVWSNEYIYANGTTGQSVISDDVDLLKGTYYFCIERYSGTGNYTFSISDKKPSLPKATAKQTSNSNTSIKRSSNGKSSTASKKTAKVKSVKLTAKKKKLNVKWKKVNGATGYEVMYAKNNKFKGKKTVKVKKNKVTLKRLKSKKKYFVKVRAYKTINGNTSYGKWSKTVKVKVK